MVSNSDERDCVPATLHEPLSLRQGQFAVAEPISTNHRLKCAINCRCPAAERAEYPSVDNSSRKPAA